jgi:ribosome recycling factor
METVKKMEKDQHLAKDEHDRLADQVQKATDHSIGEVEQMLTGKEKEILTV